MHQIGEGESEAQRIRKKAKPWCSTQCQTPEKNPRVVQNHLKPCASQKDRSTAPLRLAARTNSTIAIIMSSTWESKVKQWPTEWELSGGKTTYIPTIKNAPRINEATSTRAQRKYLQCASIQEHSACVCPCRTQNLNHRTDKANLRTNEFGHWWEGRTSPPGSFGKFEKGILPYHRNMPAGDTITQLFRQNRRTGGRFMYNEIMNPSLCIHSNATTASFRLQRSFSADIQYNHGLIGPISREAHRMNAPTMASISLLIDVSLKGKSRPAVTITPMIPTGHKTARRLVLSANYLRRHLKVQKRWWGKRESGKDEFLQKFKEGEKCRQTIISEDSQSVKPRISHVSNVIDLCTELWSCGHCIMRSDRNVVKQIKTGRAMYKICHDMRPECREWNANDTVMLHNY